MEYLNRKILLFVFMFCLFFSFCGKSFSSSFSPQFIREVSQAVKILVTVENNEQIGQGTGFFVTSTGYILTNYHVIKGSAKVVIYEGGKYYNVTRVLAADKDADIALLETEYPQSKIHYLPLKQELVELGEPVMVLGYPKIFQLGDSSITVTKGDVSSLRKFSSNTFIQFTAVVTGGSSGSPIIDGNGEVVGLVQGGMNLGQGMFVGPSSKSILRHFAQFVSGESKQGVHNSSTRPSDKANSQGERIKRLPSSESKKQPNSLENVTEPKPKKGTMPNAKYAMTNHNLWYIYKSEEGKNDGMLSNTMSDARIEMLEKLSKKNPDYPLLLSIYWLEYLCRFVPYRKDPSQCVPFNDEALSLVVNLYPELRAFIESSRKYDDILDNIKSIDREYESFRGNLPTQYERKKKLVNDKVKLLNDLDNISKSAASNARKLLPSFISQINR